VRAGLSTGVPAFAERSFEGLGARANRSPVAPGRGLCQGAAIGRVALALVRGSQPA